MNYVYLQLIVKNMLLSFNTCILYRCAYYTDVYYKLYTVVYQWYCTSFYEPLYVHNAEGKYHGSYTFFVLADVSSLSSRSSIHFSQYVEVTAVEDLRFS